MVHATRNCILITLLPVLLRKLPPSTVLSDEILSLTSYIKASDNGGFSAWLLKEGSSRKLVCLKDMLHDTGEKGARYPSLLFSLVRASILYLCIFTSNAPRSWISEKPILVSDVSADSDGVGRSLDVGVYNIPGRIP